MAEIISLADIRAAHKARETMQSIRAEFEEHFQRSSETPGGFDWAGGSEILTRMWAHRRENQPPPGGGSRVVGSARRLRGCAQI